MLGPAARRPKLEMYLKMIWTYIHSCKRSPNIWSRSKIKIIAKDLDQKSKRSKIINIDLDQCKIKDQDHDLDLWSWSFLLIDQRSRSRSWSLIFYSIKIQDQDHNSLRYRKWLHNVPSFLYNFNIIISLMHGCYRSSIQSSAIRRDQYLVICVPALTYHICLAFSTAFTEPGMGLLAEPCIINFQIHSRVCDMMISCRDHLE